MRKVALRMGEIPTSQIRWQLKPNVLKELINGKRDWHTLADDDFRLELRQKGVDMRLGLDFAPAAKLARREGIDFVLDPLWSTIRSDLFEHIDGLRTVCPQPTGPRSDTTPNEAA